MKKEGVGNADSFFFLLHYNEVKPNVAIQKKEHRSVLCSCGGRTRTCDLQVMSLASYQLLHSAMLFCGCKGTPFLLYSQIKNQLFYCTLLVLCAKVCKIFVYIKKKVYFCTQS